MDDVNDEILSRERALADFDHARDDFEDAFSKVPDKALGYKPDGDDYTIGSLLPHITTSLRDYSRVVDEIKRTAFGEVRMTEYGKPDNAPGQTSERATALINLEAAHDTLAGQLKELAYEDFNRKASVYYPGSTTAHPTGASDILGWVTGHYREHISHLEQLLESWSRR